MPDPEEVPGKCSSLVSLLLLVCVLDMACSVCPRGYIGLHCKYKCRCTNFGCDDKGDCIPNATCHSGYFGPQCQYRNAVNTTNTWAEDNSDSTCNPSTSPGDVTVQAGTLTLLTWVRLHIQNPQSIGNASNAINVKLNGTADCLNKRVYTFRPNILDVGCDNNALISYIVISGSITPHICTVFISRGRNVAFHQNTTVIGVSRNDSTILPVDDNYYCQVANPKVATQVFINIDNEQILYQIRFVLDNGFTSHDITLTTYNGSTAVASHVEKAVAQRITNVFMFSLKPFNTLHVQVTPKIEFCELEVYGDTWCELHHYGIDCQHGCQCSPSEVCFPPTGMCGQECPPGSYGYLCSLKCNSDCINNRCDYISGKCDTECPKGTYGANCTEKCPVHCKDANGCNRVNGNCSVCETGYYGARCHLQCPVHCLNNNCHNVTGVCFGCVSGYFGSDCSSTCDNSTGGCVGCASGYFGPDCTTLCPDGCLNSKCNVNTGSCLHCKPSRYGQRTCLASECRGFVLVCVKTCSEGCLNKTCNETTGVCFACASGFEGPMCIAIAEESSILLWVALMIIPLLLLLCILLAYCCCVARKRRLKGEEEKDKKHKGGSPKGSPSSSWTFDTSVVTVSGVEPRQKTADFSTQVD